MPDKFKNKYRNASTRAQWWDYGWNGAYFITICTKNREHYFGEIVDGQMHLSDIGHFANSCWNEIPTHFPFVELGDFVVMPDHVHGIVIINKPYDGHTIGTQNFASLESKPMEIKSVMESETTPHDERKNHFGPQSKNLASIIKGIQNRCYPECAINPSLFCLASPFP